MMHFWPALDDITKLLLVLPGGHLHGAGVQEVLLVLPHHDELVEVVGAAGQDHLIEKMCDVTTRCTVMLHLKYIINQGWAFGICGSLVKVERLLPGQNDYQNKLLLGQGLFK